MKQKKQRNRHYVYVHFDNLGLPRYVGSGSLYRATTFSGRHKSWIEAFGGKPSKVEIIASRLSKEDANKLEIQTIKSMTKAGCNLINCVLSQGFTFADYSHEDQMRLAEKRSGENHWSFGVERPQETRDKISKSKLENPTRYWLGKKRSAETIAKIKAAPRDPAQGKRHSEFMKGRKLSEEHKAKIAAGLRRRKAIES